MHFSSKAESDWAAARRRWNWLLVCLFNFFHVAARLSTSAMGPWSKRSGAFRHFSNFSDCGLKGSRLAPTHENATFVTNAWKHNFRHRHMKTQLSCVDYTLVWTTTASSPFYSCLLASRHFPVWLGLYCANGFQFASHLGDLRFCSSDWLHG